MYSNAEKEMWQIFVKFNIISFERLEVVDAALDALDNSLYNN